MNTSNQIKLSVIIPVYNVSLYLDQCIESVFDQDIDPEQLQIILVNDGSTDGSELIANAWKEKSSSVEVISQENAGLSAARNVGLAAAKGQFLIFLDSDDVVPHGVYKRMLTTLERTGSDFITGAIHRFSSGQRRSWPFNRNIDLYEEDKTRLNFLDHPEYVRDFTAWNKIYRTDFFIQSKVRFPEGKIYEDIATSPLLYLKASAFDVFSDPSYYWRITPGSITQTLNPAKTLDRLYSLDLVQREFLTSNLPKKVIDEYNFSVLDYNLRWIFLDFKRHDVETQDLALDLIHKLLQKIDLESLSSVQEPIFTWAKLAKSGDFNKLRKLLLSTKGIIDEALSEKSVSEKITKYVSDSKKTFKSSLNYLLDTWKRRFKHVFIYLILRPLLFVTPIKSKSAVFSSYWGRQFTLSDGPPSIAVKLHQLDPSFEIVVVSKHSSLKQITESVTELLGTSSNIKIVINDTIPFYYYLWRSKFLFNDVNFPVGFRTDKLTKLRKGQFEIETTHGVPLKKMGIDSELAVRPKDRRKFLAKAKRYTHLVSTSPFVAETFANSHQIRPEILKTGLPQNDILWENTSELEIVELKKSLGLDPDKKTILYAPTFRFAKGYSFRYLIDFLKLEASLSEEYQIVIKPHPFNHTFLPFINFRELSNYSTNKDSRAPFIFIFGEVRDHPGYVPVSHKSEDIVSGARPVEIDADINQLMTVSDTLITDYSSIMFSYFHLQKPMVLFSPDIEFYNSTRGSYFNIDEHFPGPVTKSTDQLEQILLTLDDTSGWDVKYSERISSFRDKFLIWEQGNAAEQIISTLNMY